MIAIDIPEAAVDTLSVGAEQGSLEVEESCSTLRRSPPHSFDTGTFPVCIWIRPHTDSRE
ncbi:hypothetical protein PENTCL1PPCAC_30188 [Pristionchus entomophagus]|uniref:Ribosomal protein n=1 Tax=Pristionchus entomophagus TaxID=358040 RepID=A0AAV5UMY4_9BILA|nr:hypothetical protein PENTCL1PPCAC_30188 [Pristionchus entomophagus]